MANIIKQIVNGNDDAQTIKMIVQPAERGPQGPQGPRGPQGPQGLPGLRGEDGVIHYRAGVGIRISDDNFISATGEAIATWGGIEGDINDQADLQQEFSQYEKSADLATVAESGDYNDLTNKPTINDGTLTIQSDGVTVGTFTANSSSNVTADIIPPVRVGSVLSEPTDIEFVDTANIVDSAVTASKIDFTTLTFGNYSTVEQDTGFTWVDGDKIYKKTVDTGQLPNNSQKSINHNISNLKRVIKFEGWAYRSTDGACAPLPYSSTNLITLLVNPTKIFITTNSDRTEFMESYVTLYYTKTS